VVNTAVLENVIFDPDTRDCDFESDKRTENTRSAYPIEFMPLASPTGCAGQPKNIIFLTADAFGVMPPIAKLTPAQAMYHFLSGYTAKSPAPRKAWSASSRNSRPALLRRFCRGRRRNTATCCAT
jgi:phosphoenolpyruvate carboxykinase (ATP)